MPGRKFAAGNLYRYGFNGKENDNEVKGEGNQQDYGMRVYDPRLGRFLSLDPLEKNYPELTPYQFASNTPIQAIDLDGLERYDFTFSMDKQGKTVLIPMNDGKPQDFEEDHFSPGWGGGVFGFFHTYVTVKNPRVEYVVHHQDTKQYYTEPGTLNKETFTYDETRTFSSFEDASEMDESWFDWTVEDVKVKGAADEKFREPFLYAGAAEYSSRAQKTSTTTATDEQTTAANGGNVTAATANNEAELTVVKPNRTGAQEKLKQLGTDPKTASADKGWIKQETNQIDRGTRKSIRNPPGKVLAHERGREAAKGYSYKHSKLQTKDLHKLQHKYDKNGKLNKERVVNQSGTTNK